MSRRLLAAGAVLPALFAIGTFLPRNPDFDLTFGLEAFRPLGAGILLAAVAALAFLTLSPGPGEWLGAALASAGKRFSGPAGPLTLATFFGLAAWGLSNHALSGDAGTVVFSAAVDRVHPSNVLTCWLFMLPDRAFGLDPVSSIRLISILAGVLYAWSSIALAGECAPAGPRRAGIATVLLTTGGVGIFFGTIEVYAPVVAVLTLYLLVAVRDMKRRGPGFLPAFVLGVAFCLHGSAGVLTPTLLLVVNRGRLRPLVSRRLLLAAAVFLLPILLAGAGLWFGTWGGRLPPPGPERTGTFLGTQGEGPFLPLVLSPHEPRQRYAVLDPEHAVGMLNLLALLAPVGLALFLLGRRSWRDPAFRLAALSSLLLFALANLWNVSYSLRRDWDLFSSLAPPCALLGALAWFGRERTPGDVVRVAAFSLFATLPLLVSNSVADENRAGFGYDMARSLRRAIPTVAAREAALAAREAAERQGVTATGIPGDIFFGEATTILRLTMLDHRVLDRTRVQFEAGKFRKLLTGILADRGPPASDRERLAYLLGDALEESLRRAPPSPEILALLAVRRTLSHVEALRILGVRPGDEPPDLALLDAMDEAMEAPGAFRLVRAPPLLDRWERGLVENFRRLASQSGATLSPEAWGAVATAAIAETVEDQGGAGPYRQWLRLDSSAEEWTRWARRFSPPGLSAAVSRAEWVAAGEGLEPAVRYAIAERYARHGLERVPGHPAWLSILAGAVYLQGRHEEAIGIYRRAIRARPDDLDPRLDLALALRHAGQNEEALAVLERGVRVAPWHARVPSALALMADLRLLRGDAAIARSVASSALEALDRGRTDRDTTALRRRLHRVLDWSR